MQTAAAILGIEILRCKHCGRIVKNMYKEDIEKILNNYNMSNYKDTECLRCYKITCDLRISLYNKYNKLIGYLCCFSK